MKKFKFANKKFSTKKQTFLAKRLSFLLRSGLPLISSLELIQKQSKSPNDIMLFQSVIKDIQNGQSLSGSLNKFRKIFGSFFINVIKAGEHSGTLMENLNYLAKELKKKEILKKKIQGALLYPILITTATFGVTGFLTIYIFPKIIPIFQSLNKELPLSTKILMWCTFTFKNHWLIILAVVSCFLITAVAVIRKQEKIRTMYHKLLLKLPVFGQIIQNYNLTNSLRTLGLLLESGIPLETALIIVSETTDNLIYTKAFKDSAYNVLKGKTLAESMYKYPSIFKDISTHLIAVGEKSGNLPETLIYLSEFYEYEFDDQTKNLSSTLEPILMMIMGLMVGFIAISVITPIYEITNNIKK